MIRFKNGDLSGSFDWTADALFRPSLAIFSGDRLAEVVPTTRNLERSASGQAVWRCVVQQRRISIDSRARHVVTCLETGEILFSEPAQETACNPTAASDVAALVNRTRNRRRQSQGTGFLSFLMLPLVDQLSIIGKDLLEEDIEEDEQRDIERRIVAGEMTILDVRDDLLGSERFRQIRRRSVDEYVGRWLIWEGLSIAGTRVLRPSPLTGGRENVRDEIRLITYLARSRSREDTSFHLAKIALGGQSPGAVLSEWVRDHSDTIDHVLRVREQSVPDPPRVRSHSEKGLRFQNLLSMLTVGPAGRRRGAAIEGRSDTRGILAFGPYMRLAPGAYRLTASIKAAVTDDGAHRSETHSVALFVEVGYRDAVIGYEVLNLVGVTAKEYHVDFQIEPEWAHLLSENLFEFRFSTVSSRSVTLQKLELEMIEEEGPAPSPIEWLSKMTFMPGRRAANIWEKLRRKPRIICFGPHVRLLPGRYDVSFQCAPHPSLEIATASVKGGGQVVVDGAFQLGSGKAMLNLSFSVDDRQSFEDLSAPFEFVLTAPNPTHVNLLSIITRLQAT